MRFVLFYHSLVSDWNHAGAHVLRGVATELLAKGHSVRILEPVDGWSLHNLREQGGEGVIKAFHATYPRLRSSFYDPATVDLDDILADADVVVAHEWNEVAFLRRLGEHRSRTRSYKLLFHDSPHRALKNPLQVRELVLPRYDGVLASSEGLRALHEEYAWAGKVWTWREAVDTRVFRPATADSGRSLDLIWIGSWGEGERADELDEFLLEPVRSLGLRARFYGTRYPKEALRTLRASGIDYGGWIPDFCIPAVLASARLTVNVPVGTRADGLPHTPVIRVLQALACGVPVVTAPWDECEELFVPESDLLVGHNGPQMQRHLLRLRGDPEFARFITANGNRTVLSRHTCAHRAQELLAICHELGADEPRKADELEQDAPKPTAAGRSHVPAAWS